MLNVEAWPELRDPVMVVVLSGWVDAGMAGSGAADAVMRLAVIDDHELVREGIVALLRSHDEHPVVITYSGADVALALESGPGLALLDVQWCTEHLASLGAREIPRKEFLQRLQESQLFLRGPPSIIFLDYLGPIMPHRHP